MTGEDALGVGAVVLFSSRPESCIEFYRAIGLPLEREQHDDDGPVHYACELGDVHVAVFPAEGHGNAPELTEPGSSFVGFAVPSVQTAVDNARQAGCQVMQEPVEYPWGVRAVLRDPDGRPVEVFTPPS